MLRLFRRRKRRSGDERSDQGSGRAVGRSGGLAVSRAVGRADWRLLPPLVLTVREPAVTVAPSMGVMAAAVDQPLILAPNDRRPAADSGGPIVGTVMGLATVRAEPVPGKALGAREAASAGSGGGRLGATLGARLPRVARELAAHVPPAAKPLAAQPRADRPGAGYVRADQPGAARLRASQPILAQPPATREPANREPATRELAAEELAARATAQPLTSQQPASRPNTSDPHSAGVQASEPPAARLPLIQRRTAKAVASPTPHPSLVKAADEYVGEPFAESTPYASSSWLRMVESYRPPWMPGAAPDAIPDAISEGVTWSSIAPPPPPEERSQPPKATRRASLAESRRLGLGSPIRAQDALDAEPGPVPPEPVLPAEAAPPELVLEPVPVPVPVPDPEPKPMAVPLPQAPDSPRAAKPVCLVYHFAAGARPRSVRTVAAPSAKPAPASAAARTPAPKALIHPRTPSREPASRPQEPPPIAAVPEVAPPALAEAVRREQGVDVSDVPIHRGPEATAAAQALGARALARDGEVLLPSEAGPLDRPVARGLLAHELTHAAQQRVLGAGLPAEDSAAGMALEAEAVAAERRARGLGTPLNAPPITPPNAGGSMPAASWTAPWQAAATPQVQRQATDVTIAAVPSVPPSGPASLLGVGTGTAGPPRPDTPASPTSPTSPTSTANTTSPTSPSKPPSTPSCASWTPRCAHPRTGCWSCCIRSSSSSGLRAAGGMWSRS